MQIRLCVWTRREFVQKFLINHIILNDFWNNASRTVSIQTAAMPNKQPSNKEVWASRRLQHILGCHFKRFLHSQRKRGILSLPKVNLRSVVPLYKTVCIFRERMRNAIDVTKTSSATSQTIDDNTSSDDHWYTVYLFVWYD